MKKYSRRKRRSAFANLCIILFSIIVILASVLVIKKIVVFLSDVKIDNNVNFGTKEETPFETGATKQSMFIKDSNGLKYKKANGTFANNEWIEFENDIYRFDATSYAVSGPYYECGQIFTLEDGKLVKIEKDDYYINQDKEYFSPAYSEEYVVFLAEDEEIEKFYPIQYKHLDNEKEQNDIDKIQYLGTESKKQYSSKNMLQIDSNYIYFLCLGEEEFCSKVNRMRMNSSIKETFGKNVEGYIAKFGNVWICENGKITKCTRGDKEGVATNKILQDKIKPLETEESSTEKEEINENIVVPILGSDEKISAPYERPVERPIEKPVDRPVDGPKGEPMEIFEGPMNINKGAYPLPR